MLAGERIPNDMAIAGFLLSLTAGLLGGLCFTPTIYNIGGGLLSPLMAVVAIVCGLQGLVFGAIGIGRSARLGSGRGLGWAGFLLGLVTVLLVFALFESGIAPVAFSGNR